MERKALMEALAWRALAHRVDLAALCHQAGLSRTIAYRWKKGEGTPTLETVGKLERQLDAMIAERTAA